MKCYGRVTALHYQNFPPAISKNFPKKTLSLSTTFSGGVAVVLGLRAVAYLVLVDYLRGVVVRVSLVDEVDVLLRAIVEGESLDVVSLYGLRLVGVLHASLAHQLVAISRNILRDECLFLPYKIF